MLLSAQDWCAGRRLDLISLRGRTERGARRRIAQCWVLVVIRRGRREAYELESRFSRLLCSEEEHSDRGRPSAAHRSSSPSDHRFWSADLHRPIRRRRHCIIR